MDMVSPVMPTLGNNYVPDDVNAKRYAENLGREN